MYWCFYIYRSDWTGSLVVSFPSKKRKGGKLFNGLVNLFLLGVGCKSGWTMTTGINTSTRRGKEKKKERETKCDMLWSFCSIVWHIASRQIDLGALRQVGTQGGEKKKGRKGRKDVNEGKW